MKKVRSALAFFSFVRRVCLPCRVENRNQIIRKTRRHAPSFSFQDDEVERQKHAQEKEKRAQEEQQKWRLPQRADEFHDHHSLRAMGQSGLDRQVGNDEQEEDQKGADPHRPAKPDLPHEMVHHDGEDDASQAGSGYRHTQGQGTTVVKPCGYRGGRGEEDSGRSRSAANRLREDELVIFRGDRGHHETKNVEEASE